MLPTATTTTQPQSPVPVTRLLGRSIAATSTPAKLSLLRAALIVLAVVFAVGGAFGVNRRANAINDVRTASRQLLALQDIRVRIVHADAIASSSYLVGGQEDPTQRTAYLDEVATAGDGLVAVSGAATDADLEQLSEASRLLGGYVGLVEQGKRRLVFREALAVQVVGVFLLQPRRVLERERIGLVGNGRDARTIGAKVFVVGQGEDDGLPAVLVRGERDAFEQVAASVRFAAPRIGGAHLNGVAPSGIDSAVKCR